LPLVVISFFQQSKKQIIKDFEKLTAFKRELEYKYLFEVIIGDEESLNNCRAVYEQYKNISKSKYDVEIIVIEFNTNE